MSRPTIVDVAKAAGVSKATVSRVMSENAEYVRPATRDRVLAAIEQLGYRPSSIARSLTLKRTNTASILVSDVGNPFYPDVIRGVEDVALEHDYNIFLCNTSYDLDRGMTYIRSMIDKQVDGILIMSSSMSDEWLEELEKHSIPAVVLDWSVHGIKGAVGTIGVDFEPGIQAAVDHLLDLGHQRFAHISGPLRLQTSQLRRKAFLVALKSRGIAFEEVVTIESNLRLDGGGLALAQMKELSQLPTAIFTANDLMAMGLIRAARAQQMRVPEDLSVVGLDDIWLAADMEPPLTTVALPRYEIGSIAMQMLLDLLASKHKPHATIDHKQVETYLIVRQSTTQPPMDRRKDTQSNHHDNDT